MSTTPVAPGITAPAVAGPSPAAAKASPAPTGVAAVEVKDLSKRFGSVHAVEHLDLRIEQGEVVAFLGPNGAGKTTTLDMLLGLSEPTSGTVRILGDTPRRAVTGGRIAAVLQTGGLLRDITVEQTVRVIASMFKAESRVPEVMRRAGLTDLARRRVGKCSGGEQQRVKFALALLPDPDVLLLDEPTAGMDVTARRRFWEAMRADADAGRTIVFATHYLEEAEQFARRTVVVAHGTVVADAPTHRLRSSLGGRIVAATLPAARAIPIIDALQRLEGVSELSHEPVGADTRVTLHAADADAVARTLLTELGGRDLEIVAPSLESAFTALTED